MNNRMMKIQESLGDRVAGWEELTRNRFYGAVAAKHLVEAAHELLAAHRLRFITASGVDMRACVEILYHFSDDATGAVVTLRVSVPKDDLTVDSLVPLTKAAEWIEREIHEMLGVTFRGHPDPRRLLLSDDWPEGNYPLRRDTVD